MVPVDKIINDVQTMPILFGKLQWNVYNLFYR